MYDKNNIFAKILRSEIPCKKVYEDEVSLFFYDVNPITKIHVLGVPKSECVDFSDFVSNTAPELITSFFNNVNHVLGLLEINKTGYKLISNSGVNGGQEVPHFHIHILGGEKITLRIWIIFLL